MQITIATKDKVYRAQKASVESMELRGFKLIKELFVDLSGFGAPNELALTQSQFFGELDVVLKEHGKLTAKITNAGQFQIYIGLFKRIEQSKVYQVTPTVFERYEGDKMTLRLHDTDILIRDGNKYTLNSGGWKTVTTKKWINQYLRGYRVHQKDFEWFVTKTGDEDNSTPFFDGIVVTA